MKEKQRLFGFANITYGILLLVITAIYYTVLPVSSTADNYAALIVQPVWIPLNTVTMSAIFIGLLGMGGFMKAVQASKGVLLKLGFIMVLIALILKISTITWEFVIWPLLLEYHPETPLLNESVIYRSSSILAFYGLYTLFFVVGYALFGIGTVKKKLLPVPIPIALICGGVLYGILISIPPFGIIGIAVYCGAIIAVGLQMVKKGVS